MEVLKVPQRNIRNFCIIAHIDHGKSTLADRFLEMTGTVDKRHLREQMLDSMELEREKGITIKLKAVRMGYSGGGAGDGGGEAYQLNLIDTPGHVDFSYEVSRSLAACEGAILVVDASQGIQAQTVSNVYKALSAGLTIVPVLNKIDVQGADVGRVSADLAATFGFEVDEILLISAKTGEGVEQLLEEVIKKVPAPTGKADAPARGLVFDSFYDDYLGVVASVRVVDGGFDSNETQPLTLMTTGQTAVCQEIGIFLPQRKPLNKLNTGEVGYIATGLKDIQAVKVGDTITYENSADKVEPLPGYQEVKPFVFVSLFPVENDKFPQLRDALEKMALSDASLSFEPESSSALGFGFRCGFLGLLHADIIQERLEREHRLELIATTPTVEYKIKLTNGQETSVKTAAEFPDVTRISEIYEPWIKLNIVSPVQYVGSIITLCEKRRGISTKMDYPTEDRVIFEYEIPLSELVYNFFDDLKTVSSGFASLDYEFLDYRAVRAVKLDVLVHGEVVEPLSHIVLREKSIEIGKNLLEKLKVVIPRQQFKVSLQASINGKVIAREDIPAMRKDVIAKLYGGHRERKDKLLDNQRKNKARMKRLGKVDIPQEAFRQILRS